jgi:hypothetical protein
MKQNRVIALIFRFMCFMLSFIVLSEHLGIFQGRIDTELLLYYTVQSNMLAIILFAMLTVRTALGLREGKTGKVGYFARFEMVCAVDLFFTFFVYWVMLAPRNFTMDGNNTIFTFTNIVIHGVTPLLCLLDYLLFAEPKHLKYKDVYAVIIYPILYVAFASVVGFSGHVHHISEVDHVPVRFAYFFFDYDRIGALSVIYILAVLVFLLILSHGMYLIDKKVRKGK